MDSSSIKRIKLSVKHEENMKKPHSKINEDPVSYRTMFNPPMFNEDLKHINPQDVKAIHWEKKVFFFKPGNALANYKPSTTTIAMVERERIAKRTAEEVFALKKSIRELDGNFNF